MIKRGNTPNYKYKNLYKKIDFDEYNELTNDVIYIKIMKNGKIPFCNRQIKNSKGNKYKFKFQTINIKS
tara:strand:- start:2136 stop:2342 length:207 start_codon:yes stop_codon:yes gene_type:complete